jgi:nucleolar protein 56
MRTLVTKWFGCVVVDEARVVDRRDFPRDAHEIAQRLLRIRGGEVLDEERALAGKGVAVSEPRLKSLGTLRPPASPPTIDPGGADPALLREAAILVARDASRRSAEERDRFVVQSVRALDEVTKTANTLMERLRDWYGLHFPEAIRHEGDPAKFAKLLAETPDRASVAKKLGAGDPSDSIGADFDENALAAIRRFAQQLQSLYAERKQLEELIETEARSVAPTLVAIVGPLVGARLISLANGLERLTYLPASTVQTLGAENALFLHLKESKRPPKHGVLFQHPAVHTALRHQRGRAARLLAGHALIAARLDFFGAAPADRSQALKAHLDAQLARLKSKPAPPRGRSGDGPRRPGPRREAPARPFKGGRPRRNA